MKTLLAINASARYEQSVSRQLLEDLIDQLVSPMDKLIHRDLNKDVHFVSETSLGAVGTALEDRTPEQLKVAKVADDFIRELQEADIIVFGVPVYNFGPPASLKAWADLVARAGTTFRYSEIGPEGLLEGKKAYIVAVSGGTSISGEQDFMTPWFKFFLDFIGISDVELIVVDGIFGQDGEKKIQAGKDKIQQIALS